MHSFYEKQIEIRTYFVKFGNVADDLEWHLTTFYWHYDDAWKPYITEIPIMPGKQPFLLLA